MTVHSGEVHAEPAFRVVRVGQEHLGDLAELERLCFSEPWSESSLSLLLGEEALGVAVLLRGRAVAYGGMLLALDEGQITNIAVHPDCRRRGYGQAVLEALLSFAREKKLVQISLEVRESNCAAISLYEANGFSVAGRRKRFYKNPAEDAFVMLKAL